MARPHDSHFENKVTDALALLSMPAIMKCDGNDCARALLSKDANYHGDVFAP